MTRWRRTSPTDGHALDLLNQSVAEINRPLPALTLLPDGGLFNRLVTALEEALAENALSGAQDLLLLKRLRKLKSELDTMDWSDQRAWNGVRRQIDHLNEAGPTASIAAAQSGGKLH
jgi:ParB-like chromosome segregation protein Spo0J